MDNEIVIAGAETNTEVKITQPVLCAIDDAKFEENQLNGYISDTKLPHIPVVDRYYTKHYKTDVKEVIGQDFCILEHSNKICLITLARTHPILSKGLKVLNVDFKADEKNNRLENKVSGKFKRGAQMIKEGSPLCHLTCDDDNIYTVYGCVRGSLVEVNESLITNPQLVNDKPLSDGYIAVILTRQNEHQKEMARLLTEEQYQAVIDKRDSKTNEYLILSQTELCSVETEAIKNDSLAESEQIENACS